MSNNLWLVAGLGNPGSKYDMTPHNVGFSYLDYFDIELFNTFSTETKFKALLKEEQDGDNKILCVKPLTFMNNSGQSIAKIAKYYKIDPKHIIIVHDDLDIELGKVKYKIGGGSAGHNGIKSIDSSLKTPEYWRVRIGVKTPLSESSPAEEYVLRKISQNDYDKVYDSFLKVNKAIELIMNQ
jgi:PTH1 family peptidyl-tRNA hydrolase